MPSWEPSEQEIEEKLIEMAYTWGDLEQHAQLDGIFLDGGEAAERLFRMLSKAFRVEAVFGRNDFEEPCSLYTLLCDVADPEARAAVRDLSEVAFVPRAPARG